MGFQELPESGTGRSVYEGASGSYRRIAREEVDGWSRGRLIEVAEKVGFRTRPLKGRLIGKLTASLKRCPDTKHEFFRSL
ncbi:hypothetical protein SBA7_270014 [Candidatus Sulfotelmatobacter sp. SbA7]|nr:hypothetical protein SBA7_270014 [Candidatus Sulfotelmatobacter sp. SbA7]